MTITIEDIKTLESMFIVEMHSAERIFRVIENGLADIYRQSKDYKKLVKQYGKPAADKIVTTYTHRVLSHDETYNIGKLLEVNTDGKWQVATTGTSRFEFAGVMDDNGHKLIMISVLPEAKTVA